MRILVLGTIKDSLDIINTYIKKSNADIVLTVGDFGLHELVPMSKSIGCDNMYWRYYETYKKFDKPVFAIRGIHDNIGMYYQYINKEYKSKITNLTFLEDGISYNCSADKEIVNICGINGGYSSKRYKQEFLEGNQKRYFNYKAIDKLKKHIPQIVLLHDVPGIYKNKHLKFENNFFDILDTTKPHYCFVGKYNFWSAFPHKDTNVVFIPNTNKGYALLDTKDWRLEGVSLDLC